MPLRIVTANVNGVRAARRNGGFDELAALRAQVLCLQEVRATHEQLHEAISGTAFSGWHVSHSPAATLGRNGVAVLSKQQPSAVRVGLGAPEFDDHGRWIEVDIDSAIGSLTVVSAYVPTGDAEKPEKQAEKYRFLTAMDRRMAALATRATRTDRQAFVSGDFNVAHRQEDVKNWKGNLSSAGFLPEERAHIDRWLARGRWTDLGRVAAGEGPGPYTWWSWRGKAFDNDAGWRIDYALATKDLATRLRSVRVARAESYDTRWSDHAAVVVTFA